MCAVWSTARSFGHPPWREPPLFPCAEEISNSRSARIYRSAISSTMPGASDSMCRKVSRFACSRRRLRFHSLTKLPPKAEASRLSNEIDDREDDHDERQRRREHVTHDTGLLRLTRLGRCPFDRCFRSPIAHEAFPALVQGAPPAPDEALDGSQRRQIAVMPEDQLAEFCVETGQLFARAWSILVQPFRKRRDSVVEGVGKEKLAVVDRLAAPVPRN